MEIFSHSDCIVPYTEIKPTTTTSQIVTGDPKSLVKSKCNLPEFCLNGFPSRNLLPIMYSPEL